MTHESDEDSDAPETVQFSASKSAALQQASDASDQLKQHRQKLKERRRQQQEANIEQKKKKFDRLQQNRLPDDVLEALSSRPMSKKTKSNADFDDSKKEANPTDHTESEDNDSAPAADDDDEATTKDFISLNKSDQRVKAVRLSDELKAMRASAQKFADFKYNSLYGSRIKRAPSHKLTKLIKHKKKYVRN